MFTGLIERVSTVIEARPSNGVVELAIELGKAAEGNAIGDSISINGVCLTISGISGEIAKFDVSPETIGKSSIRQLKAGDKVNIERALRAGDRMGGHIVQGHVDGTAKVHMLVNRGKFWDVSFKASAELLDQMVVKGSVAVDGISLTVANMSNDTFTVAVIPQTWNETNLHLKKIGDTVNIETDIIVKVIKQHLGKILGGGNSVSIDKLREMGF